MSRPRAIQLLALGVCLGLVFAAARLIPDLNAGRRQLTSYGSQDVLVNAPPEYAFAIQAFGAFRSLIVNLAFIRAENYKEQGRYYDAMQLASWICKLQPRFPSVWEFQSWNMAWNISVTTFTAEERWNWVYNGVRLLRDEGLRWNPKAVNLYKQLAWIFNNKMSENMDDFHLDYKRNWAWRMHLVLGPPPFALDAYRPGEEKPPVADVSDDPVLEMARVTAAEHEAERKRRQSEEYVPYRTSKSLEERLKELPAPPTESGVTSAELAKLPIYEYLKSIAAAPPTLPELYAQFPETQAMVAQLRDIGVNISDERLSEDTYWYDGKLAATFFVRYRRLVDPPSVRRAISRSPAEIAAAEEHATARLDAIVGVRAGNPAGQALVRFLQRKVLTEVYKLKPERLAYLVANFGPMDFRVVDAHSLYWVVEGIIQGGETPSSFQNDKTNTARILFFSLRNLLQRNRLTFEPDPTDVSKSYINMGPDLNFIEPMHRAYTTYGPLIDPDPGDIGGAGEMFRVGHITFLMEAIRTLYFADREAEAAHYYEYLRTNYGRKPDGRLDEQFTLPLRDFVMGSLYTTIEGPRETERAVAELLFRAYDELADDDAATYNRYVRQAEKFYEAYMAAKRGDSGPRMKLRPFPDYQIDIFYGWFTTPPVNAHVTARKARLWRVAPPRLRQAVYDSLVDGLGTECNAWGFDPAKAFAEPEGMEQYRKDHPARTAADKRESNTETPVQPSDR